MSRYEYGDKSGYADHISQPVSFVSYDGSRGARTYVTRVEERVERVRRPRIVGYSYSSTMKEKEGRPREVDDFLTKILDEVNGPSVTRVDHTSDYGVGYKFGGDSPKKVYEIEYVYVGSPTSSRTYGDPYYQQWLSSQGYDHPSQRDYGVPNQPPDHDFPKDHWVKFSSPSYDATPIKSRASTGREVKPESSRDGPEVPNNRWDKLSIPFDNSHMTGAPRDNEVRNNRREWSSRPTYEGAPNNPPPSVESLSLKSSEVNPDSPREGVPNNQWGKQASPVYGDPSQRDYGDPDNRWSNSSIKPQSPKDYKGSDNQWSRSSNPNYDQPKSNSQWGNSPGKPRTSKDYGDHDNQWPRASSPKYDQPPRNEIIRGIPNNRWGNSPLKPTFDQAQSNAVKGPIGVPGNQRGPPENSDAVRESQSPRGHGARDNQGGKSSSPNYDPLPQSKALDVGSNKWGNSPLKPVFNEAPRNDINGGSTVGLKTHSPRDKGARDIQWGKPSSPVYNNNSPQNPNQEQKHGFPKGYEVPNDPRGRSTSPGYEHPPRYEIVAPPTPLKVRIPQNNGTVNGVDNQQKLEQPSATVRPSVPGVGSNTYGLEPKVNKYSQSSKPIGHSYD